MADCYYHGYSGGPGGLCSKCETEKFRGYDRDADEGDHSKAEPGFDMEVTTHDWKHGRYGRMGHPEGP